MATILEMAAEIVAAHASATNMTRERLISELSDVTALLTFWIKVEMTLKL